MKKLKTSWNAVKGYVVSALCFGVVIGLFLNGVLSMSDRMDKEGEETLRSAIARASVQCYAIEGRYPPSVEYLEENYGIKIDRNRFNVFYDGFASNVMPDITVFPNQEERGR
ncbi:MAG: hypothetical protein HFG73_07255 [Hungatella sp.]|nr:hypothetical protein [Hungatella sp.]